MSFEGMTSTIIATQIAEAMVFDESEEGGGCDLSAGMFGPRMTELVRAWAKDFAETAEESRRLNALINTPQTDDWLEAVKLEAAHQIERWGVDHDKGKKPEDYFWLIGYLSSKALVAANAASLPRYKHIKTGGTYELLSAGEDEHQRSMVAVYRGESDGKVWTRPWNEFFDGRFEELPALPNEKALHHTISTGASLLNWWRRMKGVELTFQPGHGPTVEQESQHG